MIRARWGKKSEAILRKEGYHNSNGKPDDTAARIKYMEEHLSNDKHYIPYDERHKAEEEQKALARKQGEQVDYMKPLMIIIVIVVIGVFIMYQTGMFNIP
jgi:biotin synthase-related radical SAM superfamily protein